MKLIDDPRFQLRRRIAEFADPSLEKAFRSQALDQDSRQLFIVILLASVFFLIFLALDLADGINNENIRLIVGLRIVVAAVGLVCCFALKRGPSVAMMDRAGVVFALVLFTAFAVRTVLFNFGVDEPPRIGVSGYVLILGVYMFSVLPFRVMVLVALYGSVTFVMAAVVVELRTASLINLCFWVVIVNIFGGVSAHRLHRLRRFDYVNVIIMKEANDLLVKEVKERKEAEDSAKKSQQKAEIANKAKSSFLAAASHDLRQPLHAMGMYVTALDGYLKGSHEKELIGKLESTISATNELFQAILDISKLDADSVMPEVSHIRLSFVFDRVETLHGGAAREKGVALKVVPTSAMASGDEVMIDRILSNLVSNAIRYTAPGGKVLLGVRKRGKDVRIDVIDTGKGIAAADLERVFGEFEQLGKPERDRSQGLGLGLAISRRLARLMGSDVMVASVPGRGSHFSFVLPRQKGAKDSPAEVAAPKSDADILQRVKVLVVDDDREVVEGMRDLLTLWDCSVIAATTMDQAEEAIRQNDRIDAVIADYRLGEGKTGIMVIEAISREQGRKVPAIVVTGDVGLEALNDIKQNGFQPLHKPVRPATLKAELISILSAR